MVEMLATQPPGDLSGVLSRLRPLQRLKLESTIALTTRPRVRLSRSGADLRRAWSHVPAGVGSPSEVARWTNEEIATDER
jgi:hypothetical protein